MSENQSPSGTASEAPASLPSSSGTASDKLLSGGVSAICGKVVGGVSILAVNVLVTRLLTPKETGAYFLAVSVVSIAAALGSLGLLQGAVRLISESLARGDTARARRLTVLILQLGLFGAVGCAAVLAAFGHQLVVAVFKSALISGVLGLLALWSALVTLQTLLGRLFQGLTNIRLNVIFETTLPNVLSALIIGAIWLVRAHSDLGQVVACRIVATSITMFPASILLVRLLKSFDKVPNSATMCEILAVSGPLLLTGAAILFASEIDIWALGALRSQQELAVYAAAKQLVGFVGTPLVIINIVLPPTIAELFTQKRMAELEEAVRGAAAIAAIPVLIAVASFMFLGPDILGTIYGTYYARGSTILLILSTATLVDVWTGSCGTMLIMTGYHNMMLYLTLGSIPIYVLLIALLAGRYGAIGVATAWAISATIHTIVMLLVAKYATGVWTHLSLRHLAAISQEMYRSWQRR